MNTIEIWKPIQGYENYMVSSLGRVKNIKTNHILKLKKQKNNYYQAVLGRGNYFLIHRIVATVFIPNPNNYSDVNHKDEDKSNNCVDNLEWCSHKQNMNYGTRKEKISTIISCLDLETNTKKIYPSIKDAGKDLDINYSCIWCSIYKFNVPYKNRYIFEEIKRARN